MRVDLNLLWLGAAAVVLACSLAAAIAYAARKPELVFFGTPLRGWEFATGAVAVLLLRRGVILPRTLARMGALIGLAGIGIVSATPFLKPEYRLLVQFCAVIGTGAVLLCGAFAQGGAACRLLALRPMVGLGLVSYALYLWHWPVLALVRLNQIDPPTPLENLLAGVVAPLLLALLTYVALENPMRTWRRAGGLATVRLRILAQGIGASMLVGSIGVAVVIGAVQLDKTDRFRMYGEAIAREMNKCLPGAREEGPLIECRLGTGSDARVLLWGDSHALSIAPAVNISALEAGLSGHLQWEGGCPPLPGNIIYVGDGAWTACVRRNERVLHWLAGPEMQNVTGVVLAAAWQRLYLQYWRVAATADAADTVAQLREAMLRTLGELHRIGLRVLVLGPVPEMPYPIPECTFLAQSTVDLRRCRYTRSEVDLVQRDSVDALRSAASHFDNIRFLDPKLAFCDSDFCWPGQGGSILYSDSAHLSPAGARVLRDRYKDDIAWAFAARERGKPAATAAAAR